MFQMSSFVSQVSLSFFFFFFAYIYIYIFFLLRFGPRDKCFFILRKLIAVFGLLYSCVTGVKKKKIIVYLGQKNASHDLTREGKGKMKNGPLIYNT